MMSRSSSAGTNVPSMDEKYMIRCLDLAQLGAGFTAPNPMVGAILVHEDRIIGEGYHQEYGKAHAEVNCIESVSKEDEKLIPQSTLYVTLEPCAHFGKTPPCADLIIKCGIPKVVVGCRDPFKAVNGKGIEKLRAAGVNVVSGIAETDCTALNKRFFCYTNNARPFLILKWAQSVDGRIANTSKDRTVISNEYSHRLVHKWRSEEAAILVGTNTALTDDPDLTVRLWKGKNPIRLVIDVNGRLPDHLRLFNQQTMTFVFSALKKDNKVNLQYHYVDPAQSLMNQVMDALYQLKVQSVLIEGGTSTMQSMINEGLWDEARIITNDHLRIPDGLPAPILPEVELIHEQYLNSDSIRVYRRKGN